MDENREVIDGLKKRIDGMSQYELCRAWRFSRLGDPLFQGEVGEYFTQKLKEKGGFPPRSPRRWGGEGIMTDERKELIGEVAKNTLETVKVHVSRFKGKVYVDARIFAQDDAANPTATIATKKGLCLTPDLMLELIPLLAKAQERAAALTGGRG